jgi:hypothetical protein
LHNQGVSKVFRVPGTLGFLKYGGAGATSSNHPKTKD